MDTAQISFVVIGHGRMTATVGFAEWLRESRERVGVDVQEIVEKTGLSQPYISMLERGERKPSRKTVNAIAAALSVNPDPGLVAAGFVPGPGPATEPRRLPSGRHSNITTPEGVPMEFTAQDLSDLDVFLDFLENRKKRS